MKLAHSVGCIRGRARVKALVHVPEAQVLRGVLQLLQLHKKVAWAQRMNVGGMKTQGGYVRFGFPGLSDVIGQLTDGRFFAFECKATTGQPTVEQAAFLRVVRDNGGVAGVVRSVADAEALLEAA